MITYIHRSKLEQHPDNPRRDLGDLSELAASIKRQGLLQNLTVVPSPDQPDKYRIVIGHRRFNASAIAGLEELPCIIDDKMTYPEQIAVMMSENIQRNDLTIAEKAGGVQMMMDLGMSAGEIAGNTGISDTTIRRYAKIGKLGKEDVRKAEQRGATLMQFAEISEIEDEGLRSEALAKAGTNDYKLVMFRVRTARDRAKRLPIMAKKLNAFAREITAEDYTRYTRAATFAFYDSDALDQIEGFKPDGGAEYVYIVKTGNITLYKEKQQSKGEETEAEQEARERRTARISREKELAAEFKRLRDNYMAEYLNLKGREVEAQTFVLWVLSRPEYLSQAQVGGLFDAAYLARRKEEPGSNTINIKVTTREIYDLIPDGQRLYAATLLAYERITYGNMSMMDPYKGEYKRNLKLIDLYGHLEKLGYVKSREEAEWLDGTHGCFAQGD